MTEKEKEEYIEFLEKSLLVLHQKHVYQQKIIKNPKDPQNEKFLLKIKELQGKIEDIIGHRQ